MDLAGEPGGPRADHDERATGRSDLVGLFGPQSMAWRLDREAMLLLGAGPRALLLQLAHPAVADGVADHSDFRRDPWRRLDGTLRSYLRIIYGSSAVARGEIRRLNAMHRGIVGATYDARDPDVSMWVHATLVDSTLTTYERWWKPLHPSEAERFYQETRPIGRAFGVPEARLPHDLADFRAYLAQQWSAAGPIRVTDTARELAASILCPPLPAPLSRLPVDPRIYAWTLWPAVSLLPAPVREAYRLPWGLRERLVSGWLTVAWRVWTSLLPTGFRQMPQALAADRRVDFATGAALVPAPR